MAIRIACLAFVFAIAVNAAPVRAWQNNLERLLVGTWRQALGPYVTETMFTADHHFNKLGDVYRVR